MNTALAQNTGDVLFTGRGLFGCHFNILWEWQSICRLNMILGNHTTWQVYYWEHIVTSSICTGNVLWNDSGTGNNSHFRIYLSLMTEAAALLFRRPCDIHRMCQWKVNCCYNTIDEDWQDHREHHLFTYLSGAINLNFSCPEDAIIIAIYSGCDTWGETFCGLSVVTYNTGSDTLKMLPICPI